MILARIQHHPSRVALLPDLCKRLKPLKIEVITHESDPPSPWAGYRKCLDRLPRSGHLVIVQDDTVPSENFAQAVTEIAKAQPDAPVCLFLAHVPRDASSKAHRAMRDGQRYVPISWRSFLPTVAVLWPVAKAREFRDWADENEQLPGTRGPARSDDALGGRWKMHTRQTVVACVPSIIEHPDEVESTIGRRAAGGGDKGRVAAILTEDASLFDWSLP